MLANVCLRGSRLLFGTMPSVAIAQGPGTNLCCKPEFICTCRDQGRRQHASTTMLESCGENPHAEKSSFEWESIDRRPDRELQRLLTRQHTPREGRVYTAVRRGLRQKTNPPAGRRRRPAHSTSSTTPC